MISSMESCIVVSVCLMISDDPVCPRAWERAPLRIIIRDQGKPPIRMVHSSSGLENIQPLKLGHKRFAGRDMAGVVWGADMRFTLILNDRRWTHLLGAGQTHSTANANIRYRPQNILTAPSGDIWQSPYLGCIPTFQRRLSSSSPSIFSQRLWNLDGQA